MKKLFFLLLSAISIQTYAQSNDSLMLKKIFDEAFTNGKCYPNLDYLCNKIGGRLSGSPQAAAAVQWAKQAMKDAGADTVYLQEVMVPHWVRGEKEQAKITPSKGGEATEVAIAALGGSVATSKGGTSAEVIEVKNYKEIAALESTVKGKIVFINYPMNPTFVNTFEAYGDAVVQRWFGPTEAAKYGAAGCIVRSMTLAMDKNPHTGMTKPFDETVKPIPACAISTMDAELLSNSLKKDPGLKFYFKMNCEKLPDVLSYNVVGEIRGSSKPEEIVIAGGHLDSWDNGDGAHDDGAGCVQAMEIIRIFSALNIKPERTIRAVLFMNEENGGKGATKYAELAKQNKEKHIAAIESDAGGFSPRGFGIESTDDKIAKLQLWKPLLSVYGMHDIGKGHGGADISKLKDQEVVLIGLMPDSQRYFDYHHTSIDTFDKISKRELELSSAGMAALVYLLTKYGL